MDQDAVDKIRREPHGHRGGDLIQQYRAEAQLLMAALEDGPTLGHMQV